MLDSRWVEALHAKLAVRYGERWSRLYSDLPIEVLRADWAEVLSGLKGDRIAYGLAHLPPDAPPNAMQFRALCLSAPSPTPVALPSPAPSPAGLRRVANALATLRAEQHHGPKGWAHRLREREAAGERLSSFHCRCWREALGLHDDQPAR